MKGNIGNMMKQAQQLQANMQRAQAEIAQLEVTGEAGVTVAPKISFMARILGSLSMEARAFCSRSSAAAFN